jgi:nucleoid DNA-binding protein
MNKSTFIEQLAVDLKLTASNTEEIVNTFIRKIYKTVAEGEEVNFSGFGKFSLRDYKSRTGYNPRTKGTIIIPKQKNVKFTIGSAFKSIVNSK